MLNPVITVIIVNWNGWRDTLASVQSLVSSNYQNWKCIIIDNASTDGSVLKMTGLDSRCHVVALSVNLGFSGGCNVGVKRAWSMNSDAIFLLNSDAFVRSDTLSLLCEAWSKHPDSILGPVVRHVGSGTIQFFGSSRSPMTGAPYWYTELSDHDKLRSPIIESDFIFGAALFAGAKLFKTVGLFDERFFLTYEETDWCYRAIKKRIRCLVVRDAVVDHIGSAAMGSSDSPIQAYFLQRNRLLFYEKHAGFRLYVRGLRSDVRSIIWGIAVESKKNGIWAMPSASRLAVLVGFRDYITRRFGDCPAEIKRLAAR